MSALLVFGANGYIGLETLKNIDAETKIGVDYNNSNLKNIQTSKTYTFNFDMTNPDNYNELTIFLKKNNIWLDKIVFCQGINPMDNFFTSNFTSFNNTINTNLVSVFIGLKKLYEFFNDSVSIVILASQNGVVGHEDRIDYGCSKAALIQLVKNLSLDFAKYSEKDIKVNTLSPTYVSNNSNKEFFKSIKGKKLKKNIPFNSILEVKDVINGVDFLLSSSSLSMRGQNLILDYGYTIK
ncbi:short-chain dehydrogenase [Staphylococcus warneri]|uniref:SDR family oxidoreductase n=1 Tax=Staphylococcus warneri TaxID=1292 RepID=UPI000D1D2CDA|nr:SDR family oxidoreductase [Staphylococcus warneri]PTI59905.1 short-chain dehydrogenase [Staphylococcus warneri]